MRKPSQPVSLNIEQIQELNQKFSTLRHDVNNHLSLIMAATELIRHKPELTERMMQTLCEQPPKISAALAKFTADFERAFGLIRS
jgi:hypothetical protein